MSANKLALLVGDYHSDSDNDDAEHRQKMINEVTTDWTQCTDANSGHPYYWNIITKEVTWEMPIEYQQFLEYSLSRNANSLKKWILCHTDDSAPYYFNEVTREISWEKPDDLNQLNSYPQGSDPNTYKRNEPAQLSNGEHSSHGTAKTKLNLVPEYNSDDSDDEHSKPVQKPLFPSTGNANTAISQPIKPIELSKDGNSDPMVNESARSQSPKSDQKSDAAPKKKQSFASIITGGRSPQDETIDIQQFITEDQPDEVSNQCDAATGLETENLSQKTFKRKRRIEFKVSGVPAKRPQQNDDSNESAAAATAIAGGGGDTEATNDVTNTIANAKAKYSNFQKGETEFVEQHSSNSNDVVSAKRAPNDEMTDEQQILEAKLNFLCQGRADVSPVQIIQIQLQALQAAHMAEALHADYLLEWMRNISNDLTKLENDAAPAGWKCLWNREKALYCYENTETGEIQWEYPQTETADTASDNVPMADDAMDICTTPPPNEHEDLTATVFQTNDSHAAESISLQQQPPPAPKWTTDEATKTNIEKPLDDELASFYSDIAKLHPDPTNDENSCDKSPTNTDATNSPEHSADATAATTTTTETETSPTALDDKKKKKKKKPKKLEPWRSGNLETWINKWQKAQKELDG